MVLRRGFGWSGLRCRSNRPLTNDDVPNVHDVLSIRGLASLDENRSPPPGSWRGRLCLQRRLSARRSTAHRRFQWSLSSALPRPAGPGSLSACYSGRKLGSYRVDRKRCLVLLLSRVSVIRYNESFTLSVYFDYTPTPLAPEVLENVCAWTRDVSEPPPASITSEEGEIDARRRQIGRLRAACGNGDVRRRIRGHAAAHPKPPPAFRGRGGRDRNARGRRHMIASGIEMRRVKHDAARSPPRLETTMCRGNRARSPTGCARRLDATPRSSGRHANNEVGGDSSRWPTLAAIVVHEHWRDEGTPTRCSRPARFRWTCGAIGVDLRRCRAHTFNGPKGAGAL